METTCRFCSAYPSYDCTSCGLVCDNCIAGCVKSVHVFNEIAEG